MLNKKHKSKCQTCIFCASCGAILWLFVFACRSGKRSVTASLAAQAAGLAYDKHLAGGILGWKAAGLPTKTGD